MPPSNDPAPRWAAWLFALWGERAQLLPLPSAAPRPILTGRAAGERLLHLPQAPPGLHAAAAAHAAAHWRFGAPPQPRTGLKPLQQALLGVLEDARVEGLAAEELPGLRTLWLPFHAGADAQSAGLGSEALLARLARALLLPQPDDPHPWIRKACAAFLVRAGGAPAAAGSQLRALASGLGSDLGQMRLPFDAANYQVAAAYRDDGSWLWERREADPASSILLAAAASEEAGGRREPDSVGGAAYVARYAEWDGRIGRYRPDWCRVFACPGPEGGARPLSASAADRRRVGAILVGLASPDRVFRGRAAHGDELHAMAAVDARVRMRCGQAPDERVYRRRLASAAPLAVQMLLDASASTAMAGASGRTRLARLLALSLAGAEALERGGHACAVLSFCSRTRERIELRQLKDWEEPVAAPRVRARLAAQRSGGSTRTGAALRHAVAVVLERVRRQQRGRPAVLVLGDGEAHDVDAPDPAYLREDLRRAVREAEAAGVAVRFIAVED